MSEELEQGPEATTSQLEATPAIIPTRSGGSETNHTSDEALQGALSTTPTVPNGTEENDPVEAQPVDGIPSSHAPSFSLLPIKPTTSSVPRKRKPGKGWNDPGLPAGHSSEYESGRVTCETCGESVSFRDEETGGFTLKHWDAHKIACSNGGETPADTATYSADTVVDASGNPPNKRRRAKRSEEERIEYLRSDPYVSHFEPYRVLCAACHRWIRLRPNSTYCSIPWDAHRKSCLARKRSNAPENEERAAALAADPDAKKFDSERVHCRTCNKWIPVGADEQAVQTWAAHKAVCVPGAGTSASASGAGPSTCGPAPNVPPPSQHQMALASMPAIPRALPPAAPSPRAPKPAKEKEALPPPPPPAADAPAPATPPDFPALAPPQMPHESRRRNAEQRLAMLRADPLLGDVEPNRVYCSLCQKWVQLRQDSSYCAYPWIQHRSKCILRNQKKAQQLDAELAAVAEDSSDEDADGEEDLSALDEVERERRNEEASVAKEMRREEKRRLLLKAAEHPAPFADVGYAGEYPDAESSRRVNGKGKQPAPSAFADLDSPTGRLKFVLHSISYLFQTTYEQSDDLTMAALVAYLNTAMPPDKHEDFDTAEVIRAAKTLADRGKIAFEGDTLKLLD